jgi:hypothetical protein
MALTISTERERHLLYALALMCDQYLGEHHEGRTVLDHMWMGAGEEAYKVLAAYGLIDIEGRGATWTESGEQLMDLRLNQQAFPQ